MIGKKYNDLLYSARKVEIVQERWTFYDPQTYFEIQTTSCEKQRVTDRYRS